MNTSKMVDLVNGLYKLNASGKGSYKMYEAMDYDHWVYAMEDDKPVNFLNCTYGNKSERKEVMKKLSKEVKDWVSKSTDAVWAELYTKSWKLWHKEYGYQG